MSINLEAIEARLNTATPGPWEWHDVRDETPYSLSAKSLWAENDCIIGAEDVYPGYPECGEDIVLNISPSDAAFIAHAPEDIKALLAEVKRQDERIEFLSAIIEAYIEICDKNRSTIAKLMDALSSVTAERDAAVEFIRFIDQNYSGYMEDSDRFDEWREKYGRSGEND